jgi:hypothetical protein
MGLLYKLLLESIGVTTNTLEPDSSSPLYRLFELILSAGVKPSELTIVSFNYDLQAEKALMQIHREQRYVDSEQEVAAFPQYYGWEGVLPVRGAGPDDLYIPIVATNLPMLRLLKLHGSVNWFSLHRSAVPPTSVLFDPGRSVFVTNNRVVRSTFRYRDKKRSEHALPVIIPPVNHKSGIMPHVLYPVWQEAREALSQAELVVVFGYSCPPSDFEAASLLRRASIVRNHSSRLVVCDPNAGVVGRFHDLLQPLSTVHYADFMQMHRELTEIVQRAL